MSLRGLYVIILAIAFVLLIPISAYAEVQVHGTIISGSSDASIVTLKIQDANGELLWEKALGVDNNFEIEMPRLEAGNYMLFIKYGSIGGASEVLEFTYSGPQPTGVFELVIELPQSDGEDFGIYANLNESTNFQNLRDFILDSDEPIRALEVIKTQMSKGTTIANENLSTVSRWTPDGQETLEYGIFWTELRAHNDINRIAGQILELMDGGMNLGPAFDSFNYVIQEPTPEVEPEACVGCSMEDAREKANEMLLEDIPVSVWTDKTYYGHNDMIMVTGQVEEISGFPLTISVLSPLNSLVTHDQLTVANDGSFEATLNTAGAMWKYDGTYTIKATYGSAEKSNSAKIELTGGVAYSPEYSSSVVTPEPTPEAEPKKLRIASFVDKSKDPQSYIDRYNSEPSYKKWFDDNYPEYDSIEQAVGLELTEKIPDWVKNIFLWYGQDQVSEEELLNAIKYLINEGILVVD